MIAVGVASPSAHGHAMTTTAMPASSAAIHQPFMEAESKIGSRMRPAAIGSGVGPKIAGPAKPQNRNVSKRCHEHERDEHRADPVGEALDRRLGALRLFDEAHDLRERRVRARPWSRGT